MSSRPRSGCGRSSRSCPRRASRSSISRRASRCTATSAPAAFPARSRRRGPKQRAMVATVMATEAPLMFLDEPTIGLDPFARRAVWDVLRELTRKGSTVLLTTHYLDEAEALSERLYIVEEGRVLFEGTAENAKRQIGGTLRVSIENGGNHREQFASFGQSVEEGNALHVITEPGRIHEIMDVALREHLSATVGPVTLEEAFLTIVGRSIDAE